MTHSKKTPRIARRRLKKSDDELSIAGFGGLLVRDSTPEEAGARVKLAIDRGVNYFDVGPLYGNSEAMLGPALEPYRKDVFLACKTRLRDRDGAAEEMKRSFERLRTDHFDLFQIHSMTTLEEVDQALSDDGALAAIRDAREAGKVRLIGFSGHSEEAALVAMDRFEFDTVLFPVNCTCYLQGGFGRQVVEEANARGVSVLALKAYARGLWPDDGDRQDFRCWYEPWRDPDHAALSTRFTLSEPVVAAIASGESRFFLHFLETAANFTPLTDAEREQVARMTEGVTPVLHPEVPSPIG